MKVLVVMPLGDQRGGGELMLVHLLREGRGPNIQWKVVFLQDGPLVREVGRMGVETVFVEALRLRRVHTYVSATARITALARDADVVLSWMPKAHLYGGVAATIARRPAVWYQLGVPESPHLVDRLATALPARIVLTLSKAGAKAQARIWPSRETSLVYPGVELDRFDPDSLVTPTAARRRLRLPEGPVIGIFARLQPQKGQDLAICAMRDVLLEFPAATLLVVGGADSRDSDYEDQLHGAAANLDGRVVFAGHQRDVLEWMQATDIVVSAGYGEGFGIATVEAMALRKAVVVSDSGGSVEVVRNGIDGLVFKTGDASSLAQRLRELLRDEALRERLGHAGRGRSLDFSSSVYAARIVEVLCELMESRAARHRGSGRQ